MQWNICEKFEGFQYLPYKFQDPQKWMKTTKNYFYIFQHFLEHFLTDDEILPPKIMLCKKHA